MCAIRLISEGSVHVSQALTNGASNLMNLDWSMLVDHTTRGPHELADLCETVDTHTMDTIGGLDCITQVGNSLTSGCTPGLPTGGQVSKLIFGCNCQLPVKGLVKRAIANTNH